MFLSSDASVGYNHRSDLQHVTEESRHWDHLEIHTKRYSLLDHLRRHLDCSGQVCTNPLFRAYSFGVALCNFGAAGDDGIDILFCSTARQSTGPEHRSIPRTSIQVLDSLHTALCCHDFDHDYSVHLGTRSKCEKTTANSYSRFRSSTVRAARTDLNLRYEYPLNSTFDPTIC